MELRTIRSLPRYEKEQKMAKPNENFKLSVQDVELIEQALRLRLSIADMDEKREINELLGRLHNQKQFYRPSKLIYVSG